MKKAPVTEPDLLLISNDILPMSLGDSVNEQPNGLGATDAILYAVIGAVLSYFFYTPISSFVTEAVRPSIEQALGERG